MRSDNDAHRPWQSRIETMQSLLGDAAQFRKGKADQTLTGGWSVLGEGSHDVIPQVLRWHSI